MLAHIDESLEAMLRAAVPLSAVDIDVSFEIPDEDWAAKLTRPTVNLYLWDIRRSSNRSVTGVENFERDGVQMRRLSLPRVELRYIITVWTTEHDDERTLLGGLLVAILANGDIPRTYLPPAVSELPNPTLQIARTGDTDVFQMEERMKLGIQLCVIAVVDTGAGTPVGPEVGEIGVSLTDTQSGASDPPVRRIAGEVRGIDAAGVAVRSPTGIAVVNEYGRFLINARPGDEIVLETDPPRTVIVPPIGGVVVGA